MNKIDYIFKKFPLMLMMYVSFVTNYTELLFICGIIVLA